MTLADWAEQHNVQLEFIKPRRPMQNGFIERFNRSYREVVLDRFVFQSLYEVREQTEKWLRELFQFDDYLRSAPPLPTA